MSLTIGLLAGIGVMLMWGIIDFLLAIPLKKIGTYKMLFMMNFLSLLVTLIVAAYFLPSGRLHISWKEALLLIGLGLINIVSYSNFYKAFEVGEVSIVSPIVSAYPPVAVLLAVVFLGERLSWFRGLVIAIIVAGVVLASTDLKKLKHIHTVKGVKAAILSALSYGVFFFIMGILHQTMDFLNLLVFSNLFLDVIILVYAASNRGVPSLGDPKFRSVLKMILLISAMANVAWVLYNFGITTELVSVVTTLGSMGSVVTVLLALIIFKDKLVLNQKVGVALTLLGLVLITL